MRNAPLFLAGPTLPQTCSGRGGRGSLEAEIYLPSGCVLSVHPPHCPPRGKPAPVSELTRARRYPVDLTIPKALSSSTPDVRGVVCGQAEVFRLSHDDVMTKGKQGSPSPHRRKHWSRGKAWSGMRRRAAGVSLCFPFLFSGHFLLLLNCSFTLLIPMDLSFFVCPASSSSLSTSGLLL